MSDKNEERTVRIDILEGDADETMSIVNSEATLTCDRMSVVPVMRGGLESLILVMARGDKSSEPNKAAVIELPDAKAVIVLMNIAWEGGCELYGESAMNEAAKGDAPDIKSVH